MLTTPVLDAVEHVLDGKSKNARRRPNVPVANKSFAAVNMMRTPTRTWQQPTSLMMPLLGHVLFYHRWCSELGFVRDASPRGARAMRVV
jgi:hypothetical protein